MNIYKVTNVTKYRSFQYRIMQRGLVTNIQLFKWGLTETDSCSFCTQHQHQETMVHLFATCNVVEEIWSQFQIFVETRFNIPQAQLELTPSKIILNKILPRAGHVVNFLCLVTKQYIYRQRCQSQQLSFTHLKRIFYKLECIEKYVATKNHRLEKHQRKWNFSTTQCERENNIEQYVYKYLDRV